MRRAVVALGVLAVVVLVAGCGGSGSDPLADDQGAPLALEHGATTERDGVRVEEISYGSGDDRVEAYLVSPLGTAVEKLPAVVFLHGSGDDRTEQLDTAVALFAAVHGFAMIEGTGFLGDEMDLDRIFDKVVDSALASITASPSRD